MNGISRVSERQSNVAAAQLRGDRQVGLARAVARVAVLRLEVGRRGAGHRRGEVALEGGDARRALGAVGEDVRDDLVGVGVEEEVAAAVEHRRAHARATSRGALDRLEPLAVEIEAGGVRAVVAERAARRGSCGARRAPWPSRGARATVRVARSLSRVTSPSANQPPCGLAGVLLRDDPEGARVRSWRAGRSSRAEREHRHRRALDRGGDGRHLGPRVHGAADERIDAARVVGREVREPDGAGAGRVPEPERGAVVLGGDAESPAPRHPRSRRRGTRRSRASRCTRRR